MICIPILTYHSLDSSGSVISTAPEKFRRQMKNLSDASFEVMKLRDVAGRIRENRDLPSKSVAITFDDGFQSVYDVAHPVLKEYGYPATVFLVTSFCGKNNRWYGQPDNIPSFDLLTWDQIAQMKEEQIEFGVHTATHPDLTRLPGSKISEEIVGARKTLQDRTGQQEVAFAYPYGKQSAAARAIVESHFYAACSTKMEFATPQSDVHFLPRIDMYYFANNDLFSTIGTPSFDRFVGFRKTLRGFKRMITGGL
ncbi:polysaccharide deacetylase family protein [bacterium]|nr:polysaccharide deacetylase family protein [bacterium]MCI0607086.1 polysaccharide deacetylase family protein [bacterium]